MASRLLRKRLKKMLMAAPVIASAVGCGGPHPFPGCGNQPPYHEFVSFLADAGPNPGTLPDGGLDCALCTCFVDTCQRASANGDAGLDCTCYHECTGRRPQGLLAGRASTASHPVGAFFAEVARLEAASVRAFHALRRELAAHGAPARLVVAARQAAGDEVRHARVTGALARRYGATPLRPAYAGEPEVRALEALALENAREGCVRETFGALVGAWQAATAGDPVVARAMKRIAVDETRHAELGWEVAVWAEAQLGAGARRRVRAERARGLEQLLDECRTEPSPACHVLAGLPTAATATALARELRAVA